MDTSYTTIAIGILVVAYILSRQLAERPVKEEKGFTLPAILGIVGLVQIAQNFQNSDTTFHFVAILFLLTSLISGAFFGYLRARNMHVWYDKNQLMRKGNIFTIVLWVVGIAIHLVLEFTSNKIDPSGAAFASNGLLIYVGISLGVQQYVTLQRAKAIRATHRADEPTKS